MLALYTDLTVDLRKVTVRNGSNSHPLSGAGSASSPSELVVTSGKGRKRREKAVTLSMLVSGKGRLGLSAERAEWDV
jgi:hypothetical protein